jgi:hypothetical protein
VVETLSVEDVAQLTERNLRRASRRAVTQMIEFAVFHKLTKMWTCTYADVPQSMEEVLEDVARLRRWLYAKFGNLPNYYVVELGKETGRLHLHFAFPNVFINKHLFQKAWGKGLVEFRVRRAADGKVVTDPETLARYLAKDLGLYLSKDFDITNGVRSFGGHRYHPSRDHAVPFEAGDFISLREALAFIESRRGQQVQVWCSLDDPDAEIPPVWILLDLSRRSRPCGGSP